ncbi:hypothetical protein T36_1399 [Helicobacter cinaedi]|uniref:hypothetical protein n=1 Tax=Helicobacter cinaedi TaxID=213 RepID=UPI001F2C93CE|nr:hypothetical protein [Helicobacter cinaedi]BDB64940.1 hypothetical protein T36_1399 [Helicobacter cinaedi]
MLEQLPKILEESRRQVERLLNSPLKLKAQLSEVVYPNAKYGALFSSVVRGDSALGNHSSDLVKFGVTADSCSTPNFTKSPASNTTNLRILEAENRGESEKALSPSLRGEAQAFHKKVDSSMDCHAAKAARNDNGNATGGGGNS